MILPGISPTKLFDERDFDFRYGLCVFVRILILDLGYSLRDGDGGGGRVWRGKWGPLVAESGEGGGWEEEVGGVMVVEEIE
ncbi:hypothetical protein Tco_0706445 [Tanacetum coccineum]|uniref:Uncharacterized protein n=1 Tax=Tanacetum coccineum TaxID=301880 RepID=A0ABQ4Y7E0_9ASTR